MLQPGMRGLGFAVGQEPLTALFASMGARILATDLYTRDALERGWIETDQHADGFSAINKKGLCGERQFRERVHFKFADMNRIGPELHGGFDFLWSSCAFEHLGSLEHGKQFVLNAMDCLKPGGVAVHTTEYNVSSSLSTVEEGETVLYRNGDIRDLVGRLRRAGHHIEVDYDPGRGAADAFIDAPPYAHATHLKLRIGEYTATSIGLIVTKRAGPATALPDPPGAAFAFADNAFFCHAGGPHQSAKPMIDISGIKTQTAVVNVASGVQFSVVIDAEDRNDPVASSLLAGNFPVPDLFDLLRRAIPQGGRVLDLGAHLGSFALAAAAAGYEVVCVEASPRNAAMLRASIELNGFRNLNLINAAISDRAGTLGFYSQGPYGHVAPQGDAGATITVEAIAVDELLQRVGWDKVDFIKLDIEGSEVAAVRGMTRLMSQRDAPVLFCESNGHMLDVFGESPTTLKAALEAVGCELYLVEPHRLVRVHAHDLQGQTVVDYLAVKSHHQILASGRVDPALTQAEQLVWLHRSASSSVEPERLYAARALRDCDDAFRSNDQAEMIRSALAKDPSDKVRALALTIPSATAQPHAASPSAQERPWWQIW